MLKPFPHRNVVVAKSSKRLRVFSESLLPLPAAGKDCPKNKYTTKYSFGVKSLVLRPAFVYYIRLTFADGLSVYKIGYTSLTVRRRINFFMLQASTRVDILEVIRCKSSTQAYLLEQELHKAFVAHRYRGKNLIATGNTELYTKALV